MYLAIADYLGPTDSFHVKAICKKLYLFHPDPQYLHFNPFASSQVEALKPSAKRNFAIKWASRNGHAEIVKELMADRRVDPAADDNYAMNFAYKNGHRDVAMLLLCDTNVYYPFNPFL